MNEPKGHQNNQQQPSVPYQNAYPQQQFQSEPIMQSAIKKNMTGYFENRNNTLIAIFLAVFIGIMLSFLIVEYRLGINVFIFYTLLLASTGYIMYRDDNLSLKPFIFFSVAFLSIASVFMRLSLPEYKAAAIMLLPVIYVLITVYASKQKYQSDIKTILFRGVCSVGFIHMIIVARGSLKNDDNSKKKTFIHILIGVGITIALLTIIIPLMLSADEMFRVKIGDLFENTNIGTFILKSMLSAFIAMLLFGFFYLITAHRLKETSKPGINTLPSVTTVILTIIIILAVVFTFFAVVQFGYLFVGLTDDLPAGFSYAQYARNGYFELAALSVISFTIILICVHFSKKGSKTAKKAIKIILTYFNALNIYLLVSAAYKMRLYQKEFGLTTSRLLVYILLVFEAVLILGLMVKILMEDLKFIKIAVYFSVAFWAIVSFVNVEAAAFKYNADNLYSEGEMDFSDIPWLSADASNAVCDFYIENHDDLEDYQLAEIEAYFDLRRDEQSNVRPYSVYEALNEERNWREFNISEQFKYNNGKRILDQYYN